MLKAKEYNREATNEPAVHITGPLHHCLAIAAVYT